MQRCNASASDVPAGVLHGIRILDLARHRAGAVAALLLAELGASVVKAELLQDQDRRLSALQSAIWDRSKAPVEIDLAGDTGRQQLLDLASRADVVLHDRTEAELTSLGLSEAWLAQGRSDLVVASIGSWPAGHPHAGRPVDDTLVLAEAGLLDEQQPVGRDGPVYLAFPLGSAHASFLCAAGVVVRLLLRLRHGVSGYVRTSLLQGALLPMMMYWSQAERPSAALELGMPKETPQPLYACADGNWMHVMGDPCKAPLVRSLLAQMEAGQASLANDRVYGSGPRIFPNLGALGEIFRQQPRDVWLQALWAADVPVQPVQPMGALFDDEQARACGYVVEVDTPSFGKTLQAAVPIHLTPSVKVARPAPAPDWEQHGGDTRPASRHVPAGRHPLTGLKVLDFGSYLAGPLAPMLLADLGADVVKIEAVKGEPLRFADWAFNACQRGKRAIAIDLAHPRAAAVLERLVRTADVVHHNQRLPAARKFGIDYASLKQINPRVIFSHVSAYGPCGERRDWPGYDQLFQAASGWEMESAGAGNHPTWLRFGMTDHLAALASLLGTLAALYGRECTGTGQEVAASLLGASLFTLDTALGKDGGLLPYPRLDAQQYGTSATRRLYRCEDGWIAVSEAGADAVTRLLDAARLPDARALEPALATRTVEQALALCGQASVAAVRVALANQQAFFASADNRAAGLIASYDHPVYQVYEQIGALWDFGETAIALDRPPPCLGQHTRQVLEELAFTPGEIDELFALGVVVGPAT